MGRYGTRGFNYHAQAFEGDEWPEELGELRLPNGIGVWCGVSPPCIARRAAKCRSARVGDAPGRHMACMQHLQCCSKLHHARQLGVILASLD